MPALFAAFPQAAPATLLGSNKSASMWGTAAASWRYARRVRLPWRVLLPAVALCWAGAWAGAWLVTRVPAEPLRLALPRVLLVLLLYTLERKDLGRHHAPRFGGRAEMLAACAVAGAIGFYNAVGLLAWKGHVWWGLGLVMALANVAGSLLGTRLALCHGAGFVRGVFLLVVAALIAKTGWDAYAPLRRG